MGLSESDRRWGKCKKAKILNLPFRVKAYHLNIILNPKLSVRIILFVKKLGKMFLATVPSCAAAKKILLAITPRILGLGQWYWVIILSGLGELFGVFITLVVVSQDFEKNLSFRWFLGQNDGFADHAFLFTYWLFRPLVLFFMIFARFEEVSSLPFCFIVDFLDLEILASQI